MEEAVDFRVELEDIKDAVEESNLEDVSDIYLVAEM